MQRLTKIFMAISATIIVLVASTFIVLRLTFPYLNSFRPQIVSLLNHAFDAKIQITQLSSSWHGFVPKIQIRDLDIITSDDHMHVDRLTVALDVWQSFLHWRLQFRDVIFYHMKIDFNTQIKYWKKKSSIVSSNRIYNFFLRQFNNFVLHGSQITFLTHFGKRIYIDVSHLIWINTSNRHRATCKISLLNNDVRNGTINIYIDLKDKKGLLDNGKISLKAQDIDLIPWLTQIPSLPNILQSSHLSLLSWITFEKGHIKHAESLIKKSKVIWKCSDKTHRLDVNQITFYLNKQTNAWKMDIPTMAIATDGEAWSPAALSFFWIPFSDHRGEIRIRSSGLVLERLTPFLPMISAILPTMREFLQELKPRGTLSSLSIDIPLSNASETRFKVRWKDLGWQPWKFLPGANHVSGAAEGSLSSGKLQISLEDSTLPYQRIFCAPITLFRARGTFYWRYNQKDKLILWGRNIEAQARSLWANGDFYFYKPVKGEPWLEILAGFRLNNAADAWRYFPKTIMGNQLIDYVKTTLKGGQIDNATFLFSGNPSLFPFQYNEGHFEICMPIKKADYQFQPDWPTLTNLDINLNFINNSLFIQAPKTMLGDALGYNLSASMHDFSTKKLLLDVKIIGTGSSIREYFLQTPLKTSIGRTLNELNISGSVTSNLHLEIPFNDHPITVSGNVVMKNNSLYIKSLRTQLQRISGNFYYNNKNLNSSIFNGQWLGQPIELTFNTLEKNTGFYINLGIQGNWLFNKFPILPDALIGLINGRADWKSDITIVSPINGETYYKIALYSNLNKVSSDLLQPLFTWSSQPFSISVNAKGNMHEFFLSGHVGSHSSFNSQWLLGQNIELDSGAWTNSVKLPKIPGNKSIMLSLPAIDAEKWLTLLKSLEWKKNTTSKVRFIFPNMLSIRTPALTLGGQVWHQLVVNSTNIAGMTRIKAKGKEINGELTITKKTRWLADLDYLYYNPHFLDNQEDITSFLPTSTQLNNSVSIGNFPELAIICRQCWIKGKNLGHISGNIKLHHNQLILTSGVMDTGNTRITAEGSWLHSYDKHRTSIKGTLERTDIGDSSEYIGIDTLLKEAPLYLQYNLHWLAEPWKPDIASLNGAIHSKFGKGKIENISSGNAGRILRLVSFDALLRKLQFDFRDALGKGFYFDSIQGDACLHNGILHANNLFIDGLEADISMKGYVDFNKKYINMKAMIAPEISATVGVATAFAINPVVGAAVFATMKVLTPLWNKLSIMRYDIIGSLYAPEIQKVVRYPRAQQSVKLK